MPGASSRFRESKKLQLSSPDVFLGNYIRYVPKTYSRSIHSWVPRSPGHPPKNVALSTNIPKPKKKEEDKENGAEQRCALIRFHS